MNFIPYCRFFRDHTNHKKGAIVGTGTSGVHGILEFDGDVNELLTS